MLGIHSRNAVGFSVGSLLLLGTVGTSLGANLAISIGVRETAAGGGPSVAIGANGGSLGGIEFIKLDGDIVPIDGAFHTVTYTFGTDPVTAFAGATANSILDGAYGVLEHVRIRNIDGQTVPIRLYIDNIVNTVPGAGPGTVQDFEAFADGLEVTFQEPRFSGSTSGNLQLTPNTSLVSSAAASQGLRSDQVDFQFLDADPNRWVRLTTFNTPNAPNPAILFASGATLSFDIRAELIPEPATLSVLGLGSLLVIRRRR